MSEQKIYPIWPWQRAVRKFVGPEVIVVAYEPVRAFPWHTLEEEHGVFSPRLRQDDDFVAPPEIPPEAREPKPGEVWETVIGEPHLILEEPINNGVATMSRTLSTGRVMVSKLPRPWPSDKPHGFEALIDAIRGAEE